MTVERHLDWPDCLNVRDLGGLVTLDGRTTEWRAIVRADNLDQLTPEGWAALRAYGIRTVIDLREPDERSTSVERPPGVEVVNIPLDEPTDTGFWYPVIDEEIDGTPLYYQPFLDRRPARCVTALAAVADAAPGGVVVHCGIGRDRTGLLSLLLLALAGATPEAIIEDYELSGERLKPYYGEANAAYGDAIAGRLHRQGTTAAEALRALLTQFDIEARLRMAGLTTENLRALRARLTPTKTAPDKA